MIASFLPLIGLLSGSLEIQAMEKQASTATVTKPSLVKNEQVTVQMLSEKTDEILSRSDEPRNRITITLDSRGRIELWDMQSGELFQTYRGPRSSYEIMTRAYEDNKITSIEFVKGSAFSTMADLSFNNDTAGIHLCVSLARSEDRSWEIKQEEIQQQFLRYTS